MAKIVDPDGLNQGVEITIDTTGKTIQLNLAGNLNDTPPGKSSGVTLQALYSFLKEEWLSDAALNKFKFPLKAITEAKMDWQNGWGPLDDQTRDLIRDGGWKETTGDEYMCVVSLGSMVNSSADKAYYQQAAGYSATTAAMDKSGEVNEAVMIYNHTGPVNMRGFFKIYLREQGKTYSLSNLLKDQDLSALTYTVYKIPLSNTTDIKVTVTDNDIDTLALYTGMSVDFVKGTLFETWATGHNYVIGDVVQDPANDRWYRCTTGHTAGATRAANAGNWEAFIGERQIGSEYYAFNKIVTGNNGRAEEIYAWAQRQLRKTDDINDNGNGDNYGTVNGNLAPSLMNFLGDTLQTGKGVYIDGFNVNDQNRIEFYDITVDSTGVDTEGIPVVSTKRTFPFVAAGTISFSANLVADADAYFRMYFLNDDAGANAGADFDTEDAIVVNNNAGTPIQGSVSSAAISFDFDYDGNLQRGTGSNGKDAPVVIVALGKGGAEWISGEFTITRGTGLSFPVNAADERNYANPA